MTKKVKEIPKQDRIDTEKIKLSELFSGINDTRKQAVEKLIDNAAYMSVLLEDLKCDILVNGYISKYQNGANQWGTKKSPEIEAYISLISNYSKVIKQLTDLLPETISVNSKDAEIEDINEFIK